MPKYTFSLAEYPILFVSYAFADVYVYAATLIQQHTYAYVQRAKASFIDAFIKHMSFPRVSYVQS